MDVQLRKRGAPVALALAFALVASACSAGGSPSPSSPASPSASPSASASASASIDPTVPYTSKSGTLPSVKIAQDVPTLGWAAFVVARDMNFFEYQGVKLDVLQLQSGATALQAITGGSVDLVLTSAQSVEQGVAKGLDFLAVQNTSLFTFQLCVTKDWAQQHNVTASSPFADKIMALKGATIGITGPGASSDRIGRFMLTKYGKLNPDTDAKIVQVGGSSGMGAALDGNQIQAFFQSAPSCGQTKNGMTLAQPSDFPDFQNYIFHILFGSKKWIEAHPDIVTATATAMSMGNNFVLKHPDAALKLLQKDFNTVDPQVVTDAFNQTILPEIKPDGKFDASMWQSTSQADLGAGIITKAVDLTDGGIWTNQYIGDASVK